MLVIESNPGRAFLICINLVQPRRLHHSGMAGIDWIQVIGIAALVFSVAMICFVVIAIQPIFPLSDVIPHLVKQLFHVRSP